MQLKRVTDMQTVQRHRSWMCDLGFCGGTVEHPCNIALAAVSEHWSNVMSDASIRPVRVDQDLSSRVTRIERRIRIIKCETNLIMAVMILTFTMAIFLTVWELST